MRNEPRYWLTFILKGTGERVEVECVDYRFQNTPTTRADGSEGFTTQVEWKPPEDWLESLVSISMDEVAATFVRRNEAARRYQEEMARESQLDQDVAASNGVVFDRIMPVPDS